PSLASVSSRESSGSTEPNGTTESVQSAALSADLVSCEIHPAAEAPSARSSGTRSSIRNGSHSSASPQLYPYFQPSSSATQRTRSSSSAGCAAAVAADPTL